MIAQRLGAGLVVGIALHLAATTTAMDSFVTVPQHDEVRPLVAPTPVDVSSDGRFVAFESYARLVPADEDHRRDVYVLNRSSGRVTLESGMLESWADSSHPRLSDDGRYLVFQADWLEGPLPPRTVIVLCDRSAGTSTVLRAVDRDIPNRSSYAPDISSDGRIVVSSSTATDLVSGPDANGYSEDVYALDVQTAVVRRISLDSTGAQPSRGASFSPSVSADGRWIAFVSTAPLGSAVSRRGSQVLRPHVRQVYVRDTVLGTTTRVSFACNQGSPDGGSAMPVISGDGRYVAFVSNATNLVSNDRNRAADIFLHDRHTGSTRLISRAADGGSANGDSSNPALSVDGRFVAFQSDASNLVCARRCPASSDDINLLWDVFVWDRTHDALFRASEDQLGGWMEPSIGPALDAKGLLVAFSSRHPTDLSDRVNDLDLFIRVMRHE